MNARGTFLQRPGPAAIVRVQNATVSSNGPSVTRVVGRKSDRVEMIFRRGLERSPPLAAVARLQHQPTGPDREGVLPIENKQSVERVDESRRLVLPMKAAVGRVENHAVRADRPAVQLVAGKTDRANCIALRQRVLPFPTAIARLRP